MCLLRQVLGNNNEDRVRVRYLFTNFAIVIQISNHRDKRPYDLSFGQPMIGWHINDNSWRQRYLPYSGNLVQIFYLQYFESQSTFNVQFVS